MPQCAVTTCRNSHRKTKGRRVRYHRFPAEAEVRRRWVEACGRRTANGATAFNTATARVCSLHFSPASYERDVEHELLGLPPRSRLKRGSVPDRCVPSPTTSLVVRKKHHQQQQQVTVGRPQRRRGPAARRGNHDGDEDDEEEEEEDERKKLYRGGGIDVLLALGLTPTAKLQDGGDHGLNRMHVMDEDTGKATTPAPEDLGGDKHCRESPPAAADKENTAPEEKKPLQPPPAVDGQGRAPSPRDPSSQPGVKTEDVESAPEKSEKAKVDDQAKSEVKENGEVEGEEEKKPSSPPQPTSPVAAEADKKCAAAVPPEPSPPPSPGDDDDRSSPGGGGGKRASSDSDSDAPAALKKAKLSRAELEERERAVSEYLESAAGTNLDDLQRCAAKLQQEITALEAMARAKEQEWNTIIRLKKVKEEMYLRLHRKRQVMLIMMGGKPCETMDWDPSLGEFGVLEDLRVGKGRANEAAAVNLSKSAGKQGRPQQSSGGGAAAGVSLLKAGQQLMVVPVASSSSAASRSVTITSSSNLQGVNKDRRLQRPILPKPAILAPGGGNGQNPIIGEGRQGTILDVRSIIADYRSRHPEMVPRRGRRLKSSLSPTPSQQLQPSPEGLVSSTRVSGSSGGVFSMASLALGSGSHMRAGPADLADLGFLTGCDVSRQDASSRPSSADSSRSGAPTHETAGGGGGGSFSFKDVLVQFAKLSQAEQGQPAAAGGKQPPPYPEVTLHPVLATSHSPPHPSPSSSLLHGILTKSAQRPAPDKPATFSPTLARLLTAPERMPASLANAMPTTAFHNVGHVSINDLLSSSKGRSEVTITPVTTHPLAKTKEEVVQLEEEQEDSVDRLVIDESGEAEARCRMMEDTGGDEVPECQGCHRRAAQFVCAGCGNQWYCSRDCQVSAWDEHSEVCSG